jgi:hypothetical protein
MKFLIVALSTLLLVSCAFLKPEKYIDDSGRELYRIECKHKIDGCKALAEKTCPNGYDVETSFFLPVTYSMTGMTSKVDRYYMAIECK